MYLKNKEAWDLNLMVDSSILAFSAFQKSIGLRSLSVEKCRKHIHSSVLSFDPVMFACSSETRGTINGSCKALSSCMRFYSIIMVGHTWKQSLKLAKNKWCSRGRQSLKFSSFSVYFVDVFHNYPLSVMPCKLRELKYLEKPFCITERAEGSRESIVTTWHYAFNKGLQVGGRGDHSYHIV